METTITLVASIVSLSLTVFLLIIVRQRFELERKHRETLSNELKNLIEKQSVDSNSYDEAIDSIKKIVKRQQQEVHASVRNLTHNSLKAISQHSLSQISESEKVSPEGKALLEDLKPILVEFDSILSRFTARVLEETKKETAAIRESQSELNNILVEMAAIDKFVSLLENAEEKEAAIISAIRRLGNEELLIRLAVAYPSKGATSILQDIAISGKGNELVGWALEGIADSHKNSERFDEAEIYYKQSLVALENSLGEEHQDVADVLDSLAEVAMKQGRAIEAEEFLERSTNIRDKLHGSETEEVAQSCIKLADLYMEREKYVEAKSLYGRALEITKKALGDDHEQCLNLLHKMAQSTKSAEQPAETAQIYEQIAEHQSGRELHKTLLLLIPVYEATSNWAGLESLYRKLIELCEHKETKDELNKSEHMRSLARVLQRQDKRIEATDIYKEVLEDLEGYLGPEHDDVLGVVDELSDLLIEQGFLTVAAPYVMRAFKKTLNDTDSDKFKRLLGKIKLIAERLVEKKEFDVAEDMYQNCLTSMEKLKNPPKKAIVGLLRKIGALCAQLEDYEKSSAAMRRAIRFTELIFDEDHPETMTLLMQLSHLQMKSGDLKEANEICKRVLEMRYKIHGKEHQDIIDTFTELYKICTLQDKETEAEIYQESAIEMALSLYGESSEEYQELCHSLKSFDPNVGISGGYKTVDQK